MSDDAVSVPYAAKVRDATGADGVIIYGLEGQQLTIADMAPWHAAADKLRLQVGFGVTGMVARTRKPVVLTEDSPRNPLHRNLLGLRDGQTVARMCLPLLGVHDQLVGVLAAHRSPDRPFEPDEVERATHLCTVVGLRLHTEQLWRAVHRHRSERDELIEHAVSAQEGERRRIAFDLHDGVSTALASMSFHLSAADLSIVEVARRLRNHQDPTLDADAATLEHAAAELGDARSVADHAYNQTRAAISGLHSLVLDDLGLVAAIESLVRTSTTEGGPTVELMIDPAARLESLPDHSATALYRIAQEALSNAVKHSGATKITVWLRSVGDSIVLGCLDDGRGFDTALNTAIDGDGAEHYGMRSIAERCAMIDASLRIESLAGRGTTVLVEVAPSAGLEPPS